MMISTKLTLQSYTLVLIVFTIFTVSLVEHIQIVDGFKADGNKKIYQLNPGETDMIPWAVTNTKNVTLNVVLYATGPGSELFVFEEHATIEPGVRLEIPIYVSIPEDHPNNVEYRPELFVQRPAPDLEEGVTGIAVALQYRVLPIIKIGDNPIYTPPAIDEILPETITPKTINDVKPIVETPEETIEEKLAKIKAANLANAPEELQVDDIFEESFEEEAVVDYEPEPIMKQEMKQERLQEHKEDKVECDFFAWFLSLFGMGKC